jgi:O-antigen biosynthesis protein
LDPTELVELIFSSPFVNETLCHEKLGASKRDNASAVLYLQLPIRSRPQLSYLFDATYYLEKNPGIDGSEVDPLIHFIEYGCYESRNPHPLIDFEYIRSLDPYLLPTICSSSEFYEALNYDLVDPSPYFSLEYYRSQKPKLPTSGLLKHFLSQGLQSGFRPNAFFDPLWYYRQLDGVHDVWSGLRHFVSVGDRQGRASSPAFDGARYLERYPDVAAAGEPPLAHFLVRGIGEGRASFPAQDPSASLGFLGQVEADGSASEIIESDAVASYQALRDRVASRRQDEKNNVSVPPVTILQFADPFCHPAELALPRYNSPRVSILIPVYNEANYTAECIGSILTSNPQVSYEVIVADDASPDPSAAVIGEIENIRFIRQPENLGFLRNCNAAFESCRGEYLLLLNNDAQLMPGALDYLVEVLDRDATVAAVGPKMLYPNGRLQEAGCTINRDGVTEMVGLFADPAKPCFNYDRDVHYCSGAALLVRRSELDDTLFDETFVPAYCEDTDLCLRLLSRGHRVVYCHRAEIVHHLSVSTNKQSVTKRLQLVSRNQQKLVRKWAPLLEDMNKVRQIAFYLPQYHPTPENDYYWGQGFTEWTNVSKARPAYGGHYQPHLPADLGFYDLRVKQTMQRQADMARRYGLAGFCVYYYNFGRRRALDLAFEAMVADPTIDFPYCVCWANENWTRHWDGGTKELIFEQKYDLETLLKVIADATRYATDPRYIRVNGKPLFVVYRPLLLPDVRAFARMCRQGFRDAGFNEVHLVYVESMETASKLPPPVDIGFDACIEFPPQGLAVKAADQTQNIIRENFAGVRYDYGTTVIESVSRTSVGYKRYPSVFPSWDNTPRQPLRGDSFVHATPEAFQVYVEEKLNEVTRQFVGDERLLFINAWNEWAEGTHLEPDRKFGHRWLEAIRNATMAKSLA